MPFPGPDMRRRLPPSDRPPSLPISAAAPTSLFELVGNAPSTPHLSAGSLLTSVVPIPASSLPSTRSIQRGSQPRSVAPRIRTHVCLHISLSLCTYLRALSHSACFPPPHHSTPLATPRYPTLPPPPPPSLRWFLRRPIVLSLALNDVQLHDGVSSNRKVHFARPSAAANTSGRSVRLGRAVDACRRVGSSAKRPRSLPTSRCGR